MIRTLEIGTTTFQGTRDELRERLISRLPARDDAQYQRQYALLLRMLAADLISDPEFRDRRHLTRPIAGVAAE